jgi:hypothetical protein
MRLRSFDSLLTRWILHRLCKQAYSQDDFRQMVAKPPFGVVQVNTLLP